LQILFSSILCTCSNQCNLFYYTTVIFKYWYIDSGRLYSTAKTHRSNQRTSLLCVLDVLMLVVSTRNLVALHGIKNVKITSVLKLHLLMHVNINIYYEYF
jgi:hypothetical protein